jgi:phosphinothricin acetyltransferase
MSAGTLRPSEDGDVPAIARIYGHHVITGLGSFEEVAPDAAEIARRRAEVVGRGLPYLVAEAEGLVLGYAYAAPYRARVGYRFSLEDSIYLAPEAMGRGIGRALLCAVLERSAAAGYRQMVAVIGDSANEASIALHRRLGFRSVGVLEAIGFKHGRWVDTVIMQRPLGEGGESLP